MNRVESEKEKSFIPLAVLLTAALIAACLDMEAVCFAGGVQGLVCLMVCAAIMLILSSVCVNKATDDMKKYTGYLSLMLISILLPGLASGEKTGGMIVRLVISIAVAALIAGIAAHDRKLCDGVAALAGRLESCGPISILLLALPLVFLPVGW